MPPLRGIDRGLDGEALKAFEESGHGRRLAIVDASYNIPRWAQKVDYNGPNSAEALLGILKLVPVEGNEVYFMSPDPDNDNEKTQTALGFFEKARDNASMHIGKTIIIGELCRLDEDEISRLDPHDLDDNVKGFYTTANNQEEDTLFVRTRDRLPYACATFIIGHSQTAE